MVGQGGKATQNLAGCGEVGLAVGHVLVSSGPVTLGANAPTDKTARHPATLLHL